MIEEILDIIKNNQILLTGLGLSGAGIITFWIKDVPKRIFEFLKREYTTELIITSQHKIFYEILQWIQEKCENSNFRKLKLTNGRWGDDIAITSIGYGFHYIRYKKKLFFINLTKEAANHTERDKETLSITIIGRNRRTFSVFIDEVQSLNISSNRLKMYMYTGDYWMYVKDQQRREIESIFIEKNKKESIFSILDNFIKNETWYLQNGIPYQLGILLYGAPGTGKTSLIKAISTYLNYPIYYLPPHKLTYISNAITLLPEKSILVIEDLDSNAATLSRNTQTIPLNTPIEVGEGTCKNSIKNDERKEEEIVKMFSLSDLSEILNSLDGMLSSHGRILIATTNHIEKLDGALIRPGRIDLKVEIGFVNNEILKDFMSRFYPQNSIKFENLKLKNGITVAMLQNMIMQKYTADQIIEEIIV